MMKKYLALTGAILLLLSTGCKKNEEKKEDVSLAKKYAKWNIRVYKTKDLKKQITFLSKGEPVDLLATEKISQKGKTVETAKVKLTDDTVGYIRISEVGDRPIVFTKKTKAYFRNNETSRVYFEIPKGTMAFVILEKGHWVQIFIGNIYYESGKKKWVDKKWVNGGFSEQLDLIPDAREYEKSVRILNITGSTEKQVNDAKDTLKKLLESGNLFSELAKNILDEMAMREGDSPETIIEDKEVIITENSRKVISEGGLRMRDAPDISGTKIGVIPNGQIVELLEESGEMVTISGATGKWSKVKWNNITGWVFGGFLSTDVKSGQ
jgi:SH3-like domain-containing protein